MTGRTFVDTNVLLYAYNPGDGEKHRVALARVAVLWASNRGVISVQVLQELYVNLTRKMRTPMPPADAWRLLEDLCQWDVVDMTPDRVLTAAHLSDRSQLSMWDALIVVSAADAGAEVLLTEDLTHDQVIEGVRIENPFLTA